tara:strand:- start:850 stop:1365 length:516 start_codon:yes stop_codon:yes gene_type:complete
MKKLLTAMQEPNIKFIISERSILTDKNVFAKMLYDSKYISKMDYDIYKVFYETHSSFINNIILVYIQTDPVICQDRIKKRNRKGEDSIPLEYLQMCHDYHEKWIMNDNIKHKMIINGNKNHEENKNQLNKWISKFETFLSFYDEYFLTSNTNYFMNLKNTTSKKKTNIVKI